MAEADAALGRLDDVRLEHIHETISEIIEDITVHESVEKKDGAEGSSQEGKIVNIDARKLGKAVFCIPGLGRLDDCAAMIVAEALKREGYNARVSGADTEIEAGNAEAICVCFLGEVSDARAAFTVRKLSRKVVAARVIVCRLGKSSGTQQGEDENEVVAPRSLVGVVSAVGKGAKSRARREH